MTLLPAAVAKTKRPFAIFNKGTCPIIGGSSLGTIYVSVTKKGLAALRQVIRRLGGDRHVSHLSTIESMRLYTPEDVVGETTVRRLIHIGKRRPLRLIMFRHHDQRSDEKIHRALGAFRQESRSRFRTLHYSEDIDVYEFRARNAEAIRSIISFPGTRALDAFPQYSVVRTATRVIGSLPANRILPPLAGHDYPLVGQVDTGTDRRNGLLQHWVHDRWDAVPEDQQLHAHGSFVAGLICAGRSLNHNDERFPSAAAKIVDVVAFDQTESVSEQALLRIIRAAVIRFSEVKVWNLSFSVDGAICRDHEFSPFGLALAQIAEESRVIFVIAAGNTPELRRYPRPSMPDRFERICAPSDSPTNITVGSVAHRDSSSSCVRAGEPSPFTRRGPGAGYLMAPHLAHIGGNCDSEGDATQVAVLSVDQDRNLAEDIGTSFATPLVSSLLASVHHQIRTEARPDILAKALLLHSTLLRNYPVSIDGIPHTGLGVPPDVDEIIHCRQSTATVLFVANMSTEPNFIKEHFPIPRCLVSGGSLKASITMTLAYSPPIDLQSGCECCMTNVKASLGTLHPTTGAFGYAINRYPDRLAGHYDIDLVQRGYKWAPFKYYHRAFTRRNQLGSRQWELRLNIERRAQLGKVPPNQFAYVIVTIKQDRSIRDTLPVYDQMVVEMDRLGWQPENLQLQQRPRSSN